MEKKIKLLPPTMPNFITYDLGVLDMEKQGFQLDKMAIPVEQLSLEEAQEYAELMKTEFIHHWQRKTSVKP